MQIYNAKDQDEQGKIQNVFSLTRKGAPGNVIELSPVFKETECLKKSLMLSGVKGVLTSG